MATLQLYSIRPIEARDNPSVAAIIRNVMPEFGADGPGFAIHDAEVADMHTAYSQPGTAYFVVERNNKVVGGGGVAALIGATADICELRKMYFLQEIRGLGAGQALMTQCLTAARTLGYRSCYLETLTQMHAAQKLYLKNGFQRIEQTLGNTGHHGCNTFYLRELYLH